GPVGGAGRRVRVVVQVAPGGTAADHLGRREVLGGARNRSLERRGEQECERRQRRQQGERCGGPAVARSRGRVRRRTGHGSSLSSMWITVRAVVPSRRRPRLWSRRGGERSGGGHGRAVLVAGAPVLVVTTE